MSKRKMYNAEFKAAAVARMLDEGEAPSAVSRELGVTMTQLAVGISGCGLCRGSCPAKE